MQHTFLARLRDRARVEGDGVGLHHGRSLGGAPWANWEFETVPDALPGGIKEKLFHRVDARKAGKELRYYLSTRQYAQVKDAPLARSAKLERLKRYRQLFAEAVADAGARLHFARPSGDNRGANESEIGVLFFDAKQTPTVVCDSLPAVHRAFVNRLRGHREAPPVPEGRM